MELFVTPDTRAEWRSDGSVVLTSGLPLGPVAENMAVPFRAGARAHPDRLLVAEREGDGWRRVTWGEAARLVDGLAQALLDRGAAGRPVMILSGNSVEHLLLTLAGFTVGSPVVPVSTAYSLLDPAFAKLRAMSALVRPAVVFADDADAYGKAVEVAGAEAAAAEAGAGAAVGAGETIVGREELGGWAATVPTSAVAERSAAVGPDTVAKILFTSGSTGVPKGVVNTHRMLCCNQRMLRRIWPFLAAEPPVMLDWLPWSHTFGGNHNLGLAIANGGSLYIDDGRPGPDAITRTVANLIDVRPTVYFNVPAGYASLLPHLEADRGFAQAFFSRMRFVFFAAAALPQPIWDGLGKVAASVGGRARLTTSWGATETAPAATSAYYASGRSDCIGVPLPGVSIKLAPVGPKREIRVKGPSVTPGYHDNPGKTGEAFDADGYYRTGDAVRLVDEDDPGQGLVFDGRISEDFKLSSGTWVSAGTLRSALLAAGDGLITDAVLTGHNKEHVGALVWLNQARAHDLTRPTETSHGETSPTETSPAESSAVRDALAGALHRLNAGNTGGSRTIARLLVLNEPASLAEGEITDKGYINQRAVLDRRAHLVELLHNDPITTTAVILPAAAP